ncbi:hypothetical protein PMAYCL1PPCAC_31887 [Pristionchus mayeri]|uniref:MEIS N-terminal domain-containing protein n=1 Tax=Pristionchus mayeri TaxID=1317129 RepID=A0AAN5ICY1_9BILA|nr:hypothetical protein PMAYCL1PPCAC_31887 [Pristionchus mayeri]
MSELEASTSRANGVVKLSVKESAALVRKVKAHPLFPAIEILLIKIETAMRLNGDESVFDIKDVIQKISEIRTTRGKEDAELDAFMQEMLATQATQLRELKKVIDYIDEFVSKYKHTLRKRVPIESLVGTGDSDDGMPSSPASSTDEPASSFAPPIVDHEAPSVAVMQTPQGMISIPLRLPPSDAQKTAARRVMAVVPPMDDGYRLRMVMIQAALNPNLTAEDRKKIASQLGCDPKQLESWIADMRRQSSAHLMMGRPPPSASENAKNQSKNGK